MGNVIARASYQRRRLVTSDKMIGAFAKLARPCALLWMSSSPGSLSAAAQAAMLAPDSELYFSSISALEIGIKCRNRKLVLPESIASWFPKTIARLELRELPLQSAIAIRAASLDWDHRDPADRILVATALSEDMMIITSDANETTKDSAIDCSKRERQTRMAAKAASEGAKGLGESSTSTTAMQLDLARSAIRTLRRTGQVLC